MAPNGHASWIASDYSEVIKTVTYYDDPASFDDQDGAIAGSGTTWYISPQAPFVEVGQTIQIADEEPVKVVSFEQKNDLTMPYTVLEFDAPVTPPVGDNEITHIHTPYVGGEVDEDDISSPS